MQSVGYPDVICLMGPTAVGKTQVALELARCLPVELISVDSAMVYRGLDIGTAKPSKTLLQRFPHALIDICDPIEVYSVAQFRCDALQLIRQIHARGKFPLLVGGTMLYFNALQHGLASLPQANEQLRNQLTEQASRHGWPYLHTQLRKVDSQTAQWVHPNDAQRIQRALEVYHLTGIPLSEWQKRTLAQTQDLRFLNVGILPKERSHLHKQIEQRFHHMMTNGLIAEVKRLWQRSDLHANLPAIKAVGYRQVWYYLQGKYTYSELITQAIRATRQLAKRQITWIRHWKSPIQCFLAEDSQLIDKIMNYLIA